MATKRILIHHRQEPWRAETVSEAVYDPEEHVLWGALDVDDDALPDDFPERDLVIDLGITTLAQARAVRDWDEMEGIGETREARIVAWLEENE